jgi:hypothetical protein
VKKTRKIKWSKWEGATSEKPNFDFTPEKDVKFLDNDERESESDVSTESPLLILTPLGMIPCKPFSNIWIGETNFNIGEMGASIINDIQGVDMFDVFSRYKFRIAVGGCFKFEDVKKSIEIALGVLTKFNKNNESNMNLGEDLNGQIQHLIETKLSKVPYWSLYILPNGEIDLSASQEDNSEFNDRVEIYRESRKKVGGAIFCSERCISS